VECGDGGEFGGILGVVHVTSFNLIPGVFLRRKINGLNWAYRYVQSGFWERNEIWRRWCMAYDIPSRERADFEKWWKNETKK